MLSEQQALERRLIYGSYPSVIQTFGREKSVLINLLGNYLYNDVLAYSDVRKPRQIETLLVHLALQIGNEISYHKLAKLIRADSKTVERYVQLLEQCAIVFRLNSFNNNRLNEIKKGKKIYFYDNGIRNAILQNFSPLHLRQDTGALWENYFISERQKANHYRRYFVNSFFWRTFQHQKIDLLEEADGIYTAYIIKWDQQHPTKLPVAFTSVYPDHKFHVIDRKNYIDFLM